MTGSASWQARIDCGPMVGAGFLVSSRHVLTCAHVVQHTTTKGITVTFPQAGGFGAMPARVVADGGWPHAGAGAEDAGRGSASEHREHRRPRRPGAGPRRAARPGRVRPARRGHTSSRTGKAPRLRLPRGLRGGHLAEYRAAA